MWRWAWKGGEYTTYLIGLLLARYIGVVGFGIRERNSSQMTVMEIVLDIWFEFVLW